MEHAGEQVIKVFLGNCAVIQVFPLTHQKWILFYRVNLSWMMLAKPVPRLSRESTKRMMKMRQATGRSNQEGNDDEENESRFFLSA